MPKIEKSNEFDVRFAVVDQLLKEGWDRENIRIEIPLEMNSSEGRADIVLMGRAKLHCIEIKSGKDIWCESGIKEQIKPYKVAFDSVSIVVDVAHKKSGSEPVDHGHRYFCNWQNVDLAYDHESKSFVDFYAGKARPLTTICSSLFPSYRGSKATPGGMAKLLWRSEIQEVFGGRGNKIHYVADIRENWPLSKVRNEVIQQLRKRPFNKWELTFWEKYHAHR